MFEYAPASLHFARGLALASRPLPAGVWRTTLALAAELVSQMALRVGLARPERGDSERAGNMQWASHIYERLAEIAYFDNRPIELLHATLASLNLAERSCSPREMVDGYAALSIGLQQARASAIAGYYNRRSLEVARDHGTLADVAYAHLVDSVFQATRGAWDALEDSHARASDIYKQLGAEVRWQQTQSVLYTSLVTRGLFDEGARVLTEAAAAVSRDTPVQVASWVTAAQMVIALARGYPPEALVSRLEELQGGGLHRADLIQCKGLAAHGYFAAGRGEDAVRCADEALRLLEGGVPTAWHVTPGVAGVAEVYLGLCETDRGSVVLARRAAQACALMRRYSRTTPISAPRFALLSGRHAALHGDLARATKLWSSAARGAQTLGMPWDAECAQRLLRESSSLSLTQSRATRAN
jgi:adenylate cyclase